MSYPDLTVDRLVPLEEVAVLFCITPVALGQQLQKGKFPVQPKANYPKRWSSVELREWLADARKRNIK